MFGARRPGSLTPPVTCVASLVPSSSKSVNVNVAPDSLRTGGKPRSALVATAPA